MIDKMRNTRNLLLGATCVLGIVLGTIAIAYPITNGQPDNDGHPYVGLVSDGIYACSCVAISETILVTSAHCFDFDNPPQLVFVTFEPEGTFTDPSLFSFGFWYPHPDFCLGCGPGLLGMDTHDVAVVDLSSFWPVALAEYAQLPEEGLVDTLPMGTDVTVVGYGLQWDTGGGPPVPEGAFTRYFAATKLIASKHKNSDEYIKLTANPAQEKGGVCFGDSGGPNLLDDTNTILAINSHGTNGNCAGVTYSNRIDTEYALGFINSFLP